MADKPEQKKIPVKKKPIIHKPSTIKKGQYVVYPTHGVGKVLDIEETKIAGQTMELIVISFDAQKLILRVPSTNVSNAGLRNICTRDKMKKVLDTLKGKSRVKRAMWARRAQEYESKINSGDPIAIAEVVRDLFRSQNQPEQSFSERQIYQSALERLSREYAAVEDIDKSDATEKLVGVLEVSVA